MCELSPVTFHGDTIFCVTIENQPYTPAKPIVLNLGLNWQAQATKLRNNKERWGVVIITIPSESGEQETTCIPVRKLPAFLASINPKKIKPELRERIELYQKVIVKTGIANMFPFILYRSIIHDVRIAIFFAKITKLIRILLKTD